MDILERELETEYVELNAGPCGYDLSAMVSDIAGYQAGCDQRYDQVAVAIHGTCDQGVCDGGVLLSNPKAWITAPQDATLAQIGAVIGKNPKNFIASCFNNPWSEEEAYEVAHPSYGDPGKIVLRGSTIFISTLIFKRVLAGTAGHLRPVAPIYPRRPSIPNYVNKNSSGYPRPAVPLEDDSIAGRA